MLAGELDLAEPVAVALVRRGFRTVEAAREFLAADESHDPSEFDGIGDAVAAIRGAIAAGRADHRPRRLRRRRRHLDHDPGLGAARGRRGLRLADPGAGRGRLRADDGDRRSARRAGHRPADHRRLRDHLCSRGRRRPLARDRGGRHRPPPARRRAARLPDRAPGGLGLSVPGPVRRGGRPQAGSGAPGGRARGARPRPRGARDGRRHGPADRREPLARPPRARAGAASRPSRPAGADGGRERRPRAPRRDRRLAFACRRGSTRPGASTAPTPRWSCSLRTDERRAGRIADELDRANHDRRETEREVLADAERRPRASSSPSAGRRRRRSCCGARAGTPASSASAPRAWPSATCSPAILIALDEDGRGKGSGPQRPGVRPARRGCAHARGHARALRRTPRRGRPGDRSASDLEAFRDGVHRRTAPRCCPRSRPRPSRGDRRGRRRRGPRARARDQLARLWARSAWATRRCGWSCPAPASTTSGRWARRSGTPASASRRARASAAGVAFGVGGTLATRGRAGPGRRERAPGAERVERRRVEPRVVLGALYDPAELAVRWRSAWRADDAEFDGAPRRAELARAHRGHRGAPAVRRTRRASGGPARASGVASSRAGVERRAGARGLRGRALAAGARRERGESRALRRRRDGDRRGARLPGGGRRGDGDGCSRASEVASSLPTGRRSRSRRSSPAASRTS